MIIIVRNIFVETHYSIDMIERYYDSLKRIYNIIISVTVGSGFGQRSEPEPDPRTPDPRTAKNFKPDPKVGCPRVLPRLS